MTSGARRAAAAAAVLAAAFLLFVLTLPGKRIGLPPPAWGPATTTVAGAFHVHTLRSDGTGTPDEIAAAAARAGLKFVIFTDHGNGTRAPAPPQYRSGVLCLDGVEISTAGGHYAAIGLLPAPYPIGGEPRDVVEDVTRLGGFGVAAHPDSAKAALRWYEWTAPFDGIEWINADSEWRDERPLRLGRVLLSYMVRPVESLGSLLNRPNTTLARWDALTQRRRVVALAGADAHARVGFRDDESDPYRSGWFLRLPSYRESFEAFALRVELERPLEGDAARDAKALVDAIRAGHVYTGVDSLASPAVLEFSGQSGRFSARQGDELPLDGDVHLRARVNAPDGATIVLRRNGRLVREAPVPQLEFDAPSAPAVFRVEVFLHAAPGNPQVPWLLSNPIYVVPENRKPAVLPQRRASTESYELQPGSWHVEHAASSIAVIDSQAQRDRETAFQFTLGSGDPAGQFAALVLPADPKLAGYDRLTFEGRADKPMRLSVQIRRPLANQGERWQRSVYLDQQPRLVTIFFDDMTPIGVTATWRPDLAHADAVLFVVDTTNTVPGGRGAFSLNGLRLER